MTSRTLVCLMLTSIACTLPPDPEGPYEGSCPILLECTGRIDSALKPGYLAAYGEDGSCWASGPNYWEGCRRSCVGAMVSLNIDALDQGINTCGECEADSDCAEFEDARCEDGYCARRQLGDVSDDGLSPSETETGTDAGSGGEEGEGSIDENCLVDETPIVVLDTSLGVMVVELDILAAPEATQIFLQHLSARYYDGSIIHRVIKDVLIQGGSYGPGPTLLSSSIPPIEWLTPPTLEHQPGVIAMLPTFDGSHLGAQWYITTGPTPPAAETTGVVFGALIDGAAVLDAISSVPVITVPWLGFELLDVPEEDVVVNEAKCVVAWP